MKWFELGSDRSAIADQIMCRSGECPQDAQDGMFRTNWYMPILLGHVELHYYRQRTIYDEHEGEWIKTPNAFYRSIIRQISAEGRQIVEIIDFNRDHSMLHGSSEMRLPPHQQLDPTTIWDRAMSSLDESLTHRAQALGVDLYVPMVERQATAQHLLSA